MNSVDMVTQENWEKKPKKLTPSEAEKTSTDGKENGKPNK